MKTTEQQIIAKYKELVTSYEGHYGKCNCLRCKTIRDSLAKLEAQLKEQEGNKLALNSSPPDVTDFYEDNDD